MQPITGRSTNGRSSAFDALSLGSNPSRPARESFASEREQFRDFYGSNMPFEVKQENLNVCGPQNIQLHGPVNRVRGF